MIVSAQSSSQSSSQPVTPSVHGQTPMATSSNEIKTEKVDSLDSRNSWQHDMSSNVDEAFLQGDLMLPGQDSWTFSYRLEESASSQSPR
jgi:hypothetical protein